MVAIPTTSVKVKNDINNFVRPATTQLSDRFTTRQATELASAPVDVAQISKEAIKPQPLALNATIPEPNEALAAFQQCGQTDEVCFFLASAAGLKDIAGAAKALRQEKVALG